MPSAVSTREERVHLLVVLSAMASFDERYFSGTLPDLEVPIIGPTFTLARLWVHVSARRCSESYTSS
jgi:hypothetical protein